MPKFVLERLVFAAVEVYRALEPFDFVIKLTPDIVKGLFLTTNLPHDIVHVNVRLFVIREQVDTSKTAEPRQLIVAIHHHHDAEVGKTGRVCLKRVEGALCAQNF